MVTQGGRESRARLVDAKATFRLPLILLMVSALAPIPGVAWSLATRIDPSETHGPINRLAVIVSLAIAALILSTGMLLAAAWRRRLAQRFEALSGYANDIILLADDKGRIKDANDRAIAAYGYRQDEVIGRCVDDLHPPETRGDYARLANGPGADDTAGAVFESVQQRADGRVFPVEISARRIIVDGRPWRQLIIRDITARKQAEERPRRVTRALSTLGRADAALVRATTDESLYQRVCDVIVEADGYVMAWIGLALNDQENSVRVAAVAGHDAGYLDQVRAGWADSGFGRGPTGAAIRDGATRLNRGAGDDEHMEPWRESALERGYGSTVALPLRDLSGVFGVLTIHAAEPDAFDVDELKPLEALAGDIAFGVGALRDRQARDRLAAIVESSREAIIGKTLAGQISSWNQGAVSLYGYSAEEVIGQSIEAIIPSDRREEMDRILARIANGETVGLFETERLGKDGARINVALVVSPIRNLAGAVVGASTIARDVTDQKRIERDLIRAARFDSLTGLPNRLSFVEALERAIVESRRRGDYFAVLSLDLDHFKDINDTLGHPVGDALLQSVAKRLRETVRETDTVGRFGGDEFAVISPNLEDPAGVAGLAQRLLDALTAPYLINGAEVRCGISVGIAFHGPDSPDAETLLSHADIALYRAKADGRGAVRFFTDAMDEAVRQRFILGGELRAAIEAAELFLLYQPQVDGATGGVIGLEALVRWRHRNRGVIGPAGFIPLSEQIGLAIPLGRWVINEACRQTREWLDAGVDPPRVGVNLSGLHFRRPGELERDLVAALAAHGLTADRLEFELTETVLMEASLAHGDTLLRLRQIGFRIAIDDFGKGYSSLNYLRRFPVDRIKIDQNFVKDLEITPGNEAIVKATIGLAAALGLRVIAEGVETVEQASRLLSLGCREMQGYYFATPRPPDEITALLRAGQALPIPEASPPRAA